MAAKRLGVRSHAKRGNEINGREAARRAFPREAWERDKRLGVRSHAQRGNEISG